MSSVSTQRCASSGRARGRRDAAPAESHRVAHVAARRLPHVLELEPAASNLALGSVRRDDLREDPVIVADAVADGGVLQGRKRIEKTGRQPPEAAVAESGIDFLRGNIVEVITHALQGGTRLVHEIPIQAVQGIQERAARQVLDRQIANPLDVGVRDAALGGQPAHHQLFVHGERQGIVYVPMSSLIGRLAQRAREPVEQSRLHRTGAQSGASSHRELGIKRIHAWGYYSVVHRLRGDATT